MQAAYLPPVGYLRAFPQVGGGAAEVGNRCKIEPPGGGRWGVV